MTATALPARPFILAALFAAFCASSPAAASGIEWPERRPGLWETTATPSFPPGTPAQVTRMCIDRTTDRQMMERFGAMTRDMCPDQRMTRTATGLTVEGTCRIGPMTMTSRGDITGDFQSAYQGRFVMRREGELPAAMRQLGGMLPAELTMEMSARWAGECPADLAPGDVVLPGGQRRNIRDMPASLPPIR